MLIWCLVRCCLTMCIWNVLTLQHFHEVGTHWVYDRPLVKRLSTLWDRWMVNVDKSSFIRILFHSVIYALFQDVRFIVLCALWCGYLMVTAKRVKNLRPICLCWSTADVCTIGCVAFCTVLHQIRSNLLKYVWSVSPSLFSVNCGPELLSCTSSPYYPLTENGRETSICFCVLFYLISWQNVAERQLNRGTFVFRSILCAFRLFWGLRT